MKISSKNTTKYSDTEAATAAMIQSRQGMRLRSVPRNLKGSVRKDTPAISSTNSQVPSPSPRPSSARAMS